jgi:hypothetical protein
MTRFEDHLWRDLIREHGAELAQITRPASRPGHGLRRRVLAGMSLGVAGGGAAVAVVLTAAGSSPAFAVTRNQDGTVSVVIRQLDAIHGANARLAALGLKAKFVQVPAGCVPSPPPANLPFPIGAKRPRRSWVRVVGGSVKAQLDPREVPPGQTVVVGAWRVGGVIHVSPAPLGHAGVPPCFRIPPGAIHGRIIRIRPGTAACSVAGLPGNSGQGAPTPAAALTPNPNTVPNGPPSRINPPRSGTRALPPLGPPPKCPPPAQVLPPGHAVPPTTPPTPTTPTTSTP